MLYLQWNIWIFTSTGIKFISRPHINSGQILLSSEFATDPVQLFCVLELFGFQGCGQGLWPAIFTSWGVIGWNVTMSPQPWEQVPIISFPTPSSFGWNSALILGPSLCIYGHHLVLITSLCHLFPPSLSNSSGSQTDNGRGFKGSSLTSWSFLFRELLVS